jgi:hypothetical protein
MIRLGQFVTLWPGYRLRSAPFSGIEEPDEPEAFGFLLGLDSAVLDLCRMVEGTRIASAALHAFQWGQASKQSRYTFTETKSGVLPGVVVVR